MSGAQKSGSLELVGQKYQPIWVSVSVSDLNQNSGFSRTLGGTVFDNDFENSVSST